MTLDYDFESREMEEAVQYAIEEEKRYMLSDGIESCIYLVDEYAQIEDKDSPTGISSVKLWDEQKRILREIHEPEHKLNVILKARQLGITWTCLYYAVWNLLRTPGYTVIGLSKDDDDAKELVTRVIFILDTLPDWLIVEKRKAPIGYDGLIFDATKHDVTIYRGMGTVSRFIGKAASKGAGRSLTASLVIQDEWAFQTWSREIWTASYPTINRPHGGKFIGLSTAKRGTLFEDIWNTREYMGFHGIFLSWRADPRRDGEWYNKTKKALSINKKYMQEYPETPEQAFSGGDLQAFPEFSESIHVSDRPLEIADHWRKWASWDNGYADPYAIYKYAVDEDGTVYVYYEQTRKYSDPKIPYTEQGKRFMDSCRTPEGYEKIDVIVAGLDAWHKNHRDSSGKDLIDYYREGGVNYGFIKAITDRKIGKATVHEYLKPVWDPNAFCDYTDMNGKFVSKVIIDPSCTMLIQSLPQLAVEENNIEVVEDSRIDHWYDSFRYGLNYYHALQSGKQIKDERTVIQKHKESLLKKARRKLIN